MYLTHVETYYTLDNILGTYAIQDFSGTIAYVDYLASPYGQHVDISYASSNLHAIIKWMEQGQRVHKGALRSTMLHVIRDLIEGTVTFPD